MSLIPEPFAILRRPDRRSLRARRQLARAGAAAPRPRECAAVVKADAYGVGIEAAAPALYAAGCRDFFVAQLSEGVRVRAALGARAPARIYVLNGLQADADPQADYVAHGLAPVIGSAEELARWAAFAATPADARRPARSISTPA